MTENHSSDSKAHFWVKDIRENDHVRDCYLVTEKRVGTTRKGEPFISMFLADRTGEAEGKVWEGAEALSRRFKRGDVVEIEGHAGSYRGQLQIRVSELKVCDGSVDPGLFLESSPLDPSEMLGSLRSLLGRVENTHLRALIEMFMADHVFVSQFMKAPAAKHFHHGYLGGLLEHTLSVCRLAVKVSKHYTNLDNDLLVTAAFLHDIGKIKELVYELQIDYTDQGRLLGHMVLGTEMVQEKLGSLKAFPGELAVRLKHLILSHHGQYEFGAPKRPKFLEAIALHLIDDLDAKINGVGRFMESDRQEGAWTDFNRLFERYFLKGDIGPLGEVKKERDEAAGGQVMLFTA